MKYYDFEDLYIGLKEEFEVVLTDDKMQKFKDISGDENPLHTNEELALKKGMLGKVVYGMLTSSFYSTLVGVHLPGEKCLLQGIDIIFKKPVYLNEKLKVVGEIKYINEVYRSIEIRAYIKNEKNEKVSVAKIKDINITEVLHLAAPVVKQERFNKVDLSVFKNDFSIQVLSIVEILKIIIPKMKKEKKGKIIFILSSVVKGIPPKFWTSYVTCKYALDGLLKSLVAEFSSFNIQINAISPSMINSKFLKNMDERLIEAEIEKHPLKRTIKMEEIVETINYILESKNKFLNGNNILLTGGENF